MTFRDFASELMRMLETERVKFPKVTNALFGHAACFNWPDLPIEAVTSIAWRRYTTLSVTEAAHLMALARRRAQRWREDAEAVKP